MSGPSCSAATRRAFSATSVPLACLCIGAGAGVIFAGVALIAEPQLSAVPIGPLPVTCFAVGLCIALAARVPYCAGPVVREDAESGRIELLRQGAKFMQDTAVLASGAMFLGCIMLFATFGVLAAGTLGWLFLASSGAVAWRAASYAERRLDRAYRSAYAARKDREAVRDP